MRSLSAKPQLIHPERRAQKTGTGPVAWCLSHMCSPLQCIQIQESLGAKRSNNLLSQIVSVSASEKEDLQQKREREVARKRMTFVALYSHKQQ